MNTPTAKEFKFTNSKLSRMGSVVSLGTAEQLMIEFAKIHVDAALKAAAEKAEAYIGVSDEPKVSKGSILTAYPLSNIK